MVVAEHLLKAEDALLAEGAAALQSDVVRKLLLHIQEARALLNIAHVKIEGAPPESYRNLRLRPRPPTYADIAVSHITQCQRPSTTYELMDATKAIYPTLVLCEDSLKSFRVSYSKDPRLTSVIWNKRRHWWLSHQAIPTL